MHDAIFSNAWSCSAVTYAAEEEYINREAELQVFATQAGHSVWVRFLPTGSFFTFLHDISKFVNEAELLASYAAICHTENPNYFMPQNDDSVLSGQTVPSPIYQVP